LTEDRTKAGGIN